MSNSSANVKVYGNGAVSVAPLGTDLPTGSQADLDAAFKTLGYVSSDGITQSVPTDSNSIKAWQGGDTVRVIRTSHELTYKFMPIETNEAVLEQQYGNYDAGAVEINALQPDNACWVIDLIDGDDMRRIVIPVGQLTDLGDTVYNGSDPTGAEMTITAYPDPAYAGDAALPAKAYQYDFDVSGGTSA